MGRWWGWGGRVVYPLYMADLLMKRSHTMEYFTTRREEREDSTPHTEREREREELLNTLLDNDPST